MTRAVILAGGYGTRLIPLTFNTPKALIPLVNRPVIDYILDYLAGYGLKEFVITTNYLREQTIAYLDSSRKDVKIVYPEEPSPLGTAGSVKNAGITETMVIIQGDNITEIDIGKLLAFHKAPNPSLYGIAEIEPTDGRIRNFKEKPAPNACFSNLVNTGLYILEPEALEYVPEGCAFDFSKDLFPQLVAQSEVYGCVVEGFWTDIGSLAGYMEATKWILDKKGAECAATAWIKDCNIQGEVAIADHAKIKNSVIRGPAVIGTHVTVLNSKVENSVIFPGVRLDDVTVQNSVIEQNAEIKREEILDCIR